MEVTVCPACCAGFDSVGEIIPVIADQGVNAVEMALYHPEFFNHQDPEQIDRLVYLLERSSISVRSVHAPFGMPLDFSSFDNDTHNRGVDAQIEAIEVARLLGASYVVLHASDGGITDLDHKKRLDRARGVLRELSTLAEAAEVRLALENLPSGFLCNTADEMLWLLENINSSSVGVCFDTGHANLAGDTFENRAKKLLPFTIGMHIHDNDGTMDQHQLPGTGKIDWKAFGKIYRESECTAPAAMECNILKDRNWRNIFIGLINS